MKQTILLFGSILLLLSSCQREPNVDLEPAPPPTGVGTGSQGSQSGNQPVNYYTAVIDGVTYKETVTDDNGFEAGSGMSGVDDVDLGASVFHLDPRPAISTSLGVSKGIMHFFTTSTDDEFRHFFAPGSYPYATGTENDPFNNGTTNGVYINWTDKNGEEWATNLGSGKQTGSTFKIISEKDDIDAAGRFYLLVKMQFSCTLYNRDGKQKSLKNGEMVGDFGPK